MTAEQAIKELKESHDTMRSYDIDESESRLMIALNMAIQALQAQAENRMTAEQALDLAEEKAKQIKRKLKPLADGKMCPICGSDSSHLCYVSKDDDVWAECLRCGSRVLINENNRVLGEQLISKRAVLDAINFEDIWLADAKSHNSNTKIAFSGMYKAINNLPTWETTEAVIKRSGFLKFIAENMNPNEYQWYYDQYYHTTDEKVGGQNG